MSMIRYVGVFHDRDHTPLDGLATSSEAFYSLEDAQWKLRERGAGKGTRFNVAYPVFCNGLVATHNHDDGSIPVFPVTEDAYFDLYPLLPYPGRLGWACIGEPAYRVSLGPRFGTHTETF